MKGSHGSFKAVPMRPFSVRLAQAVGFLSRLPVPQRYFDGVEEAPLAEASDTFALAGLVIALPAIVALLFASLIWPSGIAAIVALATLVAVTGALHEDGLADCADAFFGGNDTERRLTIMKDSRIGTFSALALIVQFAACWAALAAIHQQLGVVAAAVALIAAAMLSRSAIVWHWYHLPSARPDGLAASQGQPDRSSFSRSTLTAGTVSAILIAWRFGLGATMVTLVAAAALALASATLARAKIGGHTGDTLGMTQKVVEAAVLLALASA